MAKPGEAALRPKPRLRVGRILLGLGLLGATGLGLYAASWLNARRYFLVVDATEVRIERGKMLPTGHEPYFPDDLVLRKAYTTVALPGGLHLPRGETQFDDRTELDQALFRLLKDTLEHVLSQPTERTPILAGQYLGQLEALPGTSLAQQKELAALGRLARRAEAQMLLRRAKNNLEEAGKLLQGGDDPETKARAAAVSALLASLARLEAQAVPAPATAPIRTSTTSTRAH